MVKLLPFYGLLMRTSAVDPDEMISRSSVVHNYFCAIVDVGFAENVTFVISC